MDYSFFPGHGYPYITGAAPLQGSYSEDGRSNSIIGTSQSEIFDPAAIFQTPYDAFRFEPLITTPPDLSDLPITLPGTEEATPVPSSGLLDNSDQSRLDLNAPTDRRSSSEEKDHAPALSKRKAQNRAAQRAFRERKERHVKDLEAKLSQLESSATVLASDNQRLKLALQRAMTENEILRATTGTRPPATSLSALRGFSAPDSPESDDDVGNNNNDDDDNDNHDEHDEGGDHARKKGALSPAIVLSSNTLWDYIVEHPLVRGGQIDISDACDRLRRLAKPGRNGPVFHEEEVKMAIEGSRRGGGDGLI